MNRRERFGAGRAVAVPSGRLSRLTRLGAMTAGIAGNMALSGAAQLGQGRRPDLRDLLLTPRNVSRVADQLARMRGAAMKVGQLLSMDAGDVLPPELAEIMGRLRADAHFMPPRQLKTVLNRAWGEGWLGAFAHFDVRPIAAASIGQVHRAKLKDGRDLAIKVQYPGIAKSIDSDVSNVGALIRMSGLLPSGLDLAPYLAEARRQLHEETDYLLEASHLEAFRAALAADPRFRLPEVHADWTRGNVLAMSFVKGTPIDTLGEAEAELRNRVVGDLIELTLTELFDLGMMQTDPNFANYRFDAETGQVVLLDFGATRAIPRDISERYRRLMAAGLACDRAGLRGAAAGIGFIGPDIAPEHVERILTMMEWVFAALRDAPLFDFTRRDLSERLQAEGIALSEEGLVPPDVPMEILYLQRKFGGMFLLGNRLRAQVPVRALMERHIAS